MVASFSLGHIVATPGALAALERSNQSPPFFLARHAIGDWGELEPTDVAENEYSVVHGFRLLSSYQKDAGEKLWINHRSRPVGNYSALARGVLTSCLKSDHGFAGIGFGHISSVSKQLRAVALLQITPLDQLHSLCRKKPAVPTRIFIVPSIT